MSTKHAATCTKTKTFSLLLVVPVIRKLPAASPSPWGTRDDGSRGTNASRVAARTASPAPTQSMLESMVRSCARTENRDAYCARTATSGLAMKMPRVAPATHSSRLSANRRRRKSSVLAPSAARMASSFSRRTVRARIRFATFEQAMMKTSTDAAMSTSNMVRAPEVSWSRNRVALI